MKNPSTNKKKQKGKKKRAASEAEPSGPAPMETAQAPATPAVWRPGQDPIEEGEALDYDPSAYNCLHALSLDYPCLSCDILKDDLGGPRFNFPHTLYFTAATQADRAKANYLAFIKVTNLNQGRHGKQEESDEDMSSDSDDEDELPIMHVRSLALNNGANRVRSMPQNPNVVAVWEDSGFVQIFDGGDQLKELQAEDSTTATNSKVAKPTALSSHRHTNEGYALDWSRQAHGRLATGDNNAQIHVWEPDASGASWTVNGPYRGHTSSVEEIQWSPTEDTVFASCSSDHTIKIWDTRTRNKFMLSIKAHSADVNVMSWNCDTTYMLASGGDEGALKVWDLRSIKASPETHSPVANFLHHRGPVTSIEWCPHESSMIATTGADGQLCAWDLAVERDPEEEMNLGSSKNADAPQDLPPQLLFVHGGQDDLKEVHWHPQIPGMILSTAADGFNIFKPSNLGQQ